MEYKFSCPNVGDRCSVWFRYGEKQSGYMIYITSDVWVMGDSMEDKNPICIFTDAIAAFTRQDNLEEHVVEEEEYH